MTECLKLVAIYQLLLVPDYKQTTAKSMNSSPPVGFWASAAGRHSRKPTNSNPAVTVMKGKFRRIGDAGKTQLAVMSISRFEHMSRTSIAKEN